MQNPDNKNEYDTIVKTLLEMFGEVLTEDVIYSIVENFRGDLQESANAIMQITMDEDKDKNRKLKTNDQTVTNESTEDSSTQASHNPVRTIQPIQFSYSDTKLQNEAASDDNILLSYARMSKTGAVPKQMIKSAKTVQKEVIDTLALQFKQIITYHKEGTRTLILLRGVAGSGKSYLAKKIIDAIYDSPNQQNYTNHIFSADDYFMKNGNYSFSKIELPNAHAEAQEKADQAMLSGISPVIIDNTNLESWEMKPFVRMGVQNGYLIELMVPNTPWAKNKSELLRRNVHNVPLNSIKKMLDRFERGISGTDLIIKFGYDYSIDMRPPVKRTYPPLTNNGNEKSSEITLGDSKCHKNETPQSSYIESQLIPIKKINECNTITLTATASNSAIKKIISEDNTSMDDQYKDIQKRIKEFEQVENEWENGENWDDTCNPNSTDKTTERNYINLDSKPQRQNKCMRSNVSKNLMSTVSEIENWSEISMFMPSWNEHDNSTLTKDDLKKEHVEKVSSYTFMENGDTNIYSSENPLKIVTATPRDINEYYVQCGQIKIPDNWMLDKSTSTNDSIDGYKCPHEEQHFKAFTKLFKSIPETNLRDIFDKCHGDVNWAVDLVLDSMSNNFNIADRNDFSDSDAENIEQCECLAAYNIIPKQNISISIPSTEIDMTSNQFQMPQMPVKVRGKKEVSEESIQLKRQIEQNIVIAENHYSQHCLKIRKIRRGEIDSKMVLTPNESSDESKTSALDQNVSNPPESLKDSTEGDVCNEDSNPRGEDTVSIDLPKEFIDQLDHIFDRKHLTYPENINSRIDIPMSILNEINALWTQSLAYQLEENSNQEQIMIQQDEEFARQLAMKEAELSKAGKEPEIPDFKEIMDMDFAISLYQKDVAEWRNNEPNDLAAKMSRDKLHNLFPDIHPDTLSELLMAHDNNFQTTVEVLLMSTGKVDVLENKNGVSKFVMEKELERQEKLLEIERKALSEVEWPLLNKDANVDMAAVELYRKQAEEHLRFRNTNYQKAQDYIRRGITTVASYYSDVAAYHKQKFEHANSLAAASLMQVHANNCTDNATIDLHYLRVGEAKESLDLFLDTHIQKVKEMQAKNNAPWHHTLYFITGRGLHSNGRPKVKPAVIKRLLERGLTYTERNPGLLSAKVYAHNLLSHEI